MSDAPNLLSVIDNYIRGIVRDEFAKTATTSNKLIDDDGGGFSSYAEDAIRSIAQEVTEKELRNFELDVDDAVGDAIRDYFRNNSFDISPA